MDDSKDSDSPQSLNMSNLTLTPKDPEAAREEHTTLDGTTAEMPPHARPRPNTPKREADLSSLLNPTDKAELTALINWLTDAMLKHVIQLFDPVSPGANAQPSRITFWGKLPSYLKDHSLGSPVDDGQSRINQKENVKPSRSKKAVRAADKPDAVPRADNAPDQEEDLTPRLQELKKEALQHFKKWHTAVLRRIGEISIKKAANVQSGQPFSGQNRRAPTQTRNNPSGRCQ